MPLVFKGRKIFPRRVSAISSVIRVIPLSVRWKHWLSKSGSSPTHPVLAVAELMRLLVDRYGHVFEKAWDITSLIFSYTNHSLLPETLETWDIDML